jgi:hypothetical protein
VAVPAAAVPGFGVPQAANGEARDQANRNSNDGPESRPKEVSETASKDPKAPPQPKSYRVRSPYERNSFPSGVPDWFKQRDNDFDGQVFMWEYASFWTDEAARSFGRLDANGDGVITARESLSRRDVDVQPARRLFPNFGRTNIAAAVTNIRAAQMTSEPIVAGSPAAETIPPTQPDAGPPPDPSTIPQAFVAYANGVIKRFDTDRDGVLTSEEWTVMPAPPANADADGNGQITSNELAIWYVMKR